MNYNLENCVLAKEIENCVVDWRQVKKLVIDYTRRCVNNTLFN